MLRSTSKLHAEVLGVRSEHDPRHLTIDVVEFHELFGSPAYYDREGNYLEHPSARFDEAMSACVDIFADNHIQYDPTYAVTESPAPEVCDGSVTNHYPQLSEATIDVAIPDTARGYDQTTELARWHELQMALLPVARGDRTGRVAYGASLSHVLLDPSLYMYDEDGTIYAQAMEPRLIGHLAHYDAAIHASQIDMAREIALEQVLAISNQYLTPEYRKTHNDALAAHMCALYADYTRLEFPTSTLSNRHVVTLRKTCQTIEKARTRASRIARTIGSTATN